MRVAAEHRPCGWCGRRLDEQLGAGRRRRYCGQPCRQRAYEQRASLRLDRAVPAEVNDLHDRLFQLRCAAEDVLAALDDGASVDQLRTVATYVLAGARALERRRRTE